MISRYSIAHFMIILMIPTIVLVNNLSGQVEYGELGSTEVNKQTDKNGAITFNGFYGKYRMVASTPDGQYKQFELNHNNFKENNPCSVMVSVAKIPWRGRSFTGFICGLLHGSQFYIFATHNNSRVLKLDYSSSHEKASLAIAKKEMVLEIYANAAALVDPEMCGKCNDYDTAIISLKFKGGSIGVIENSRLSVHGSENWVEVLGSKGTLTTSNPIQSTAVLRSEKGICHEKPIAAVIKNIPAYIQFL